MKFKKSNYELPPDILLEINDYIIIITDSLINSIISRLKGYNNCIENLDDIKKTIEANNRVKFNQAIEKALDELSKIEKELKQLQILGNERVERPREIDDLYIWLGRKKKSKENNNSVS